MSERDELAELIEAEYPDSDSDCPYDHAPEIADRILAAGYRQLRTVDTLAELEALPENTVIRDSEPATLQLMDGQWFVPGHDHPWYVESIDLPVTVIHEPS